MNKLKDMLALSMLAFKQGNYASAAKLYTSAMNMDGLDSFISEITRQPTRSKLIDSNVPSSENTIAPSIASSSSDFKSLSSIVEEIAIQFSLSNSLLDEGDFEEESRSGSSEDDDDSEEDYGDSEDNFNESVSSIEKPALKCIGPIKFKQ